MLTLLLFMFWLHNAWRHEQQYYWQCRSNGTLYSKKEFQSPVPSIVYKLQRMKRHFDASVINSESLGMLSKLYVCSLTVAGTQWIMKCLYVYSNILITHTCAHTHRYATHQHFTFFMASKILMQNCIMLLKFGALNYHEDLSAVYFIAIRLNWSVISRSNIQTVSKHRCNSILNSQTHPFRPK